MSPQASSQTTSSSARPAQQSAGSSRRLQRSTRVTVAIALVAVAAVVVAIAAVAGSTVGLIVAGAAAVLLGAASVRIVCAELRQSREDHNRDRARQAREFRGIAAIRTAENNTQVKTLGDRLADREATIHDLGSQLDVATWQIGDLTKRTESQARRIERAESRSRVLAAEVDGLKVENGRLVSEVAVWREAAESAAENTTQQPRTEGRQSA